VFYPEAVSDSPVVPSIRMAAQNLPGTIAGRLSLGVLHIRANVTFRGRRGVSLNSNIRITPVQHMLSIEHDREKKEKRNSVSSIPSLPQEMSAQQVSQLRP